MGGLIALLYGIACYVVFLGSFLYAIVFVGDIDSIGGFLIPKTIDSGTPSEPLPGALIDALLLSVFAVQHSVMARPAFKRVWARVVPQSVERSTYVLLASLALVLIYWQWRPLPGAAWNVTSSLGVLALAILFWAGWGVVLVSTFLLNHFELFGLRQVWARMRGAAVPSAQFRTPLFYRYVRHPIYFGFILAFWAAPAMSLGHLLFAAATTAYIFIGIYLEERDLVAYFGQTYIAYRKRVSMILPMPPSR
jgi:protein-S-isoprenylcysteine O-methyltransferase Ste14